jgi:hypothetical protein
MLKQLKPHLTATHAACLVLLGLHAMLSLAYSLITPLWEPPDEIGHYSYARYLATHSALPAPSAKLSEYNESHQPPLYYALVAVTIAGVDTSDNLQPRFTPLAMHIANLRPNLHLAPAGQIMVVPDRAHDAFPYTGTAAALHRGRLVSVLLGTLAVWLTYLTARTLLPHRTDIALLATGIHALWPQFLFIGGAINNDVAIALFGSFTLWLLARLVVPHSRYRSITYVGLAFCLAGAMLSKDSAAALLICSAVVIFVLAVRDCITRRWRWLVDLGLLVAPLIALVLATAWISGGRSTRQLGLTASFMAKSVDQISTDVEKSPAASVTSLIEGLPGNLWHASLESIFAAFGGSFIFLPRPWYDIVRLSALVAAAGVLIGLRRREQRAAILLSLLFLGCVAAAPIMRSIVGRDLLLLTGRFFLPGLSALVLLIAIGLLSLPMVLNRLSAAFVLAGISLAALLSPFIAMAPAYRLPTLLDPVATPPTMQVTDRITFGDSIQLLGYSQPLPKTSQGGASLIELYWRALKPVDKDYILRIETFSVDGQSFRERLDGFPGRNVFPTSVWKPGDTFAETYYLPVKPDVPAPTLAVFRLSWLDPDTGNTLAATCAPDKPCEPRVGTLPVALSTPNAAAWADKPALHRLGEHIELLDAQSPATAQAGQTLTFTLVWRAKAAGLPALTTFIHVLGADGKLVAQVDSPPRAGTYPTGVWTEGEIIPMPTRCGWTLGCPLAPTRCGWACMTRRRSSDCRPLIRRGRHCATAPSRCPI